MFAIKKGINEHGLVSALTKGVKTITIYLCMGEN